MYIANTEYDSEGRKFSVSLVAGSQSVAAKYVSSFSVSESLSANNAITMGTVNSSKLELDLVQLTPAIAAYFYKGVKVKVSITATDTTVTPNTSRTDVLGHFYIDEVEFGEYHTDNLKTAKITAYDGFSQTEKAFTYSGSQNPSIRSLIGTIATACGISYVSADWSNSITVSEYPEDVTCRTMIGYLASLQGTVAYFTRDNKLSAKWYTNTSPLKTITRDEQYSDALEIGKSSDTENSSIVTIKYLESGTSDGTVVYPSDGVVGQSISFENPLITDIAPLQTIYNAKVKSGSTYLINFTPMTVKWKGNATIECGEIVTVKDRNDNNLTCYIMEREISYDGGYSETYKCLGENEKTVSFSTNPVMQKLNRTMSVMEQEIEAATEAITDATAMQDGVFSFIPNSTNTANVGWNIKSSTTNKVITANINGIGFSPDGGSTYNTAIYVDSNGNGHIVGSYITAASINAQQLVVGYGGNSVFLSLNAAGKAVWDVAGANRTSENPTPSNYSTYFATVMNNNPQISVISSTSASPPSMRSASFYVPQGSKVYMAMTSKCIRNSGTTSSTSYILMAAEYCSTQSGTFTGVNEFIINNTESEQKQKHFFTATASGYYRIAIDFVQCNVNSYARDISLSVGSSGEIIVDGIIRSVDGSTYFDLNEAELATTIANYRTKLRAGCITQYDNTGEVGWFSPVASGNDYYEGIYYNSQNALGISIGYTAPSSSGISDTMTRIVEIKKGDADIGGYLTTRSDLFSGLIHQRVFNNNMSDWREIKLGVGDLSAKDATYNIADVSAGTKSFPHPPQYPVGSYNQNDYYYGVVLENKTSYPLTNKINVANSSVIHLMRMNFDSYGVAFLWGEFLDNNSQRIGSAVQIKTGFTKDGKENAVWGNNYWAGGLQDYEIETISGAKYFRLIANPETGSEHYWIGLSYGNIVVEYNDVKASAALELRDNSSQLARIDIWGGDTYGAGGYEYGATTLQLKSYGASSHKIVFIDDGTIYYPELNPRITDKNGNTLSLEDDGLYYNGARLAYYGE